MVHLQNPKKLLQLKRQDRARKHRIRKMIRKILKSNESWNDQKSPIHSNKFERVVPRCHNAKEKYFCKSSHKFYINTNI